MINGRLGSRINNIELDEYRSFVEPEFFIESKTEKSATGRTHKQFFYNAEHVNHVITYKITITHPTEEETKLFRSLDGSNVLFWPHIDSGLHYSAHLSMLSKKLNNKAFINQIELVLKTFKTYLPMKIIGISPKNNSDDVSFDDEIRIEFNRELNESTVPGSVFLYRIDKFGISHDTLIDFSVTGNILTIINEPFVNSSKYKILVKSSILSTTGEMLRGDFYSSFETVDYEPLPLSFTIDNAGDRFNLINNKTISSFMIDSPVAAVFSNDNNFVVSNHNDLSIINFSVGVQDGQYCKEMFVVQNESQLQYTLTNQIKHQSEQVFIRGIFKDAGFDYSVDGKTITIKSGTIKTGNVIIVRYITGVDVGSVSGNNSTNVELDGNVLISFNKKLNPASVNYTSVKMYDSVSNAKTVNINPKVLNSKNISFVYKNAEPGIKYRIDVYGTIKGVYGELIDKSYSFYFTTKTSSMNIEKCDDIIVNSRSKSIFYEPNDFVQTAMVEGFDKVAMISNAKAWATNTDGLFFCTYSSVINEMIGVSISESFLIVFNNKILQSSINTITCKIISQYDSVSVSIENGFNFIRLIPTKSLKYGVEYNLIIDGLKEDVTLTNQNSPVSIKFTTIEEDFSALFFKSAENSGKIYLVNSITMSYSVKNSGIQSIDLISRNNDDSVFIADVAKSFYVTFISIADTEVNTSSPHFYIVFNMNILNSIGNLSNIKIKNSFGVYQDVNISSIENIVSVACASGLNDGLYTIEILFDIQSTEFIKMSNTIISNFTVLNQSQINGTFSVSKPKKNIIGSCFGHETYSEELAIVNLSAVPYSTICAGLHHLDGLHECALLKNTDNVSYWAVTNPTWNCYCKSYDTYKLADGRRVIFSGFTDISIFYHWSIPDSADYLWAGFQIDFFKNEHSGETVDDTKYAFYRHTWIDESYTPPLEHIGFENNPSSDRIVYFSRGIYISESENGKQIYPSMYIGDANGTRNANIIYDNITVYYLYKILSSCLIVYDFSQNVNKITISYSIITQFGTSHNPIRDSLLIRMRDNNKWMYDEIEITDIDLSNSGKIDYIFSINQEQVFKRKYVVFVLASKHCQFSLSGFNDIYTTNSIVFPIMTSTTNQIILMPPKPIVEISAASFGYVLVGETSTIQIPIVFTYAITNIVIYVSGACFSGGRTIVNPESISDDYGILSTNISVSFSPNAEKSFNGTITITGGSDLPGRQYNKTVSITGNGYKNP